MARSHRGFSQVPRRNKGWEEGPGGSGVNSLSTGVGALIQSGAQVLTDGATLLRLRGRFLAFLTATDSIAGGFVGAFGIGIVALPAFAAGAASVLTPLTEQDWDGWLFWSPVYCKTVTATIGDAINTPLLMDRFEIDSKAMRKLRQDDVIYGAFEATETGVSVISVTFDTRALLALP